MADLYKWQIHVMCRHYRKNSYRLPQCLDGFLQSNQHQYSLEWCPICMTFWTSYVPKRFKNCLAESGMRKIEWMFLYLQWTQKKRSYNIIWSKNGDIPQQELWMSSSNKTFFCGDISVAILWQILSPLKKSISTWLHSSTIPPHSTYTHDYIIMYK